ncbi:MAG: alanine/glycine:cation symporter family protein [Candidatus Babeliales bacterium]
MNLLSLIDYIAYVLAVPAAFILLGAALFLTVKLNFLQLRGLPRFWHLLRNGLTERSDRAGINPFYALFNAMSTSIGMGTIVGPSIAIAVGGPGALFWLVFYAFVASVTKFAEVTFAVHFRSQQPDGKIVGGPMQYLQKVYPWLGWWYTFATVFLFSCWSGLQTNVLADVLAQESIPTWVTGATLAILVFILLQGGAKRIGEFNSKLVPAMFFIYVSSSLIILINNWSATLDALSLVLKYSFAPLPALGGFLGATFYSAVRSGVYKGAFITESGMGTSSIPHAMADVAHPSDQGILAMVSACVDMLLCTLSGLLVLISGLWQKGTLDNTMMYQVFNQYIPVLGRPLLVAAICMFVIGTVIGNSFNGRQSFATITQFKYVNAYVIFVCLIIFVGSLIAVPLAWAIADVILPLVAVPNVLGLLYLAHKYAHVLEIPNEKVQP